MAAVLCLFTLWFGVIYLEYLWWCGSLYMSFESEVYEELYSIITRVLIPPQILGR